MVGHANGYSVWLVPMVGELARQLEGLIAACSGGSYGCRPPFLPHVTLLGTLPEAPDLGNLPPLEPFWVNLGEVHVGGGFFRALWLPAEAPQLLELHRALCSLAGYGRPGMGLPAPFSPHLSLKYGTARLPRHEVLRRRPSRFLAGSIEVWKTNGPVSAWQFVSARKLEQA